jgi:hypothetical protein
MHASASIAASPPPAPAPPPSVAGFAVEPPHPTNADPRTTALQVEASCLQGIVYLRKFKLAGSMAHRVLGVDAAS